MSNLNKKKIKKSPNNEFKSEKKLIDKAFAKEQYKKWNEVTDIMKNFNFDNLNKNAFTKNIDKIWEFAKNSKFQIKNIYKITIESMKKNDVIQKENKFNNNNLLNQFKNDRIKKGIEYWVSPQNNANNIEILSNEIIPNFQQSPNSKSSKLNNYLKKNSNNISQIPLSNSQKSPIYTFEKNEKFKEKNDNIISYRSQEGLDKSNPLQNILNENNSNVEVNSIIESSNENFKNFKEKIWNENTLNLNEYNINLIVDDIIAILLKEIFENKLFLNNNLNIQLNNENYEETKLVNHINEELINVENSNISVYGIRTNFNAISDFSNLIIKILFEKEYPSISKLLPNGSMILKDYINVIRNLNEPHLYVHNEYKKSIYNKMINNFNFDNLYLSIKNEIKVDHSENENIKSLLLIQKHFHKLIFDSFFEEFINLLIDKIPSFNSIFSNFDFTKEFLSTKFIGKEEDSILTAKDNLLENASILCGIIREKEDSMLGNLQFIDNMMLNQIREERILRMLALETLESEKDWADYDIFEYKSKINLSDHIFKILLDDIILNFLN